jgi:hypothetical protein
MIDDGKANGRGPLREPVSPACCRWTPINFAAINSGKVAIAPDPDQVLAGARATASADNATDLLKTP